MNSKNPYYEQQNPRFVREMNYGQFSGPNSRPPPPHFKGQIEPKYMIPTESQIDEFIENLKSGDNRNEDDEEEESMSLDKFRQKYGQAATSARRDFDTNRLGAFLDRPPMSTFPDFDKARRHVPPMMPPDVRMYDAEQRGERMSMDMRMRPRGISPPRSPTRLIPEERDMREQFNKQRKRPADMDEMAMLDNYSKVPRGSQNNESQGVRMVGYPGMYYQSTQQMNPPDDRQAVKDRLEQIRKQGLGYMESSPLEYSMDRIVSEDRMPKVTLDPEEINKEMKFPPKNFPSGRPMEEGHRFSNQDFSARPNDARQFRQSEFLIGRSHDEKFRAHSMSQERNSEMLMRQTREPPPPRIDLKSSTNSSWKQRVPTPPPPPSLTDIKKPVQQPTPPSPPQLDKKKKTPEPPKQAPPETDIISVLLGNKDVSLSNLLEAAMESVGSKRHTQDPVLKQKILADCEVKISQLYRHRISGIGAFLPDSVFPLNKKDYNCLVSSKHPFLEFVSEKEDKIWCCPSVVLPNVEQIKLSKVDEPKVKKDDIEDEIFNLKQTFELKRQKEASLIKEQEAKNKAKLEEERQCAEFVQKCQQDKRYDFDTHEVVKKDRRKSKERRSRERRSSSEKSLRREEKKRCSRKRSRSKEKKKSKHSDRSKESKDKFEKPPISSSSVPLREPLNFTPNYPQHHHHHPPENIPPHPHIYPGYPETYQGYHQMNGPDQPWTPYNPSQPIVNYPPYETPISQPNMSNGPNFLGPPPNNYLGSSGYQTWPPCGEPQPYWRPPIIPATPNYMPYNQTPNIAPVVVKPPANKYGAEYGNRVLVSLTENSGKAIDKAEQVIPKSTGSPLKKLSVVDLTKEEGSYSEKKSISYDNLKQVINKNYLEEEKRLEKSFLSRFEPVMDAIEDLKKLQDDDETCLSIKKKIMSGSDAFQGIFALFKDRLLCRIETNRSGVKCLRYVMPKTAEFKGIRFIHNANHDLTYSELCQIISACVYGMSDPRDDVLVILQRCEVCHSKRKEKFKRADLSLNKSRRSKEKRRSRSRDCGKRKSKDRDHREKSKDRHSRDTDAKKELKSHKSNETENKRRDKQRDESKGNKNSKEIHHENSTNDQNIKSASLRQISRDYDDNSPVGLDEDDILVLDSVGEDQQTATDKPQFTKEVKGDWVTLSNTSSTNNNDENMSQTPVETISDQGSTGTLNPAEPTIENQTTDSAEPTLKTDISADKSNAKPEVNKISNNEPNVTTDVQPKSLHPNGDFKSRVRNIQMRNSALRDIINKLEKGDTSSVDPIFTMKGTMLCKKCTIDGNAEIRIVAMEQHINEISYIVHTMAPSHAPFQKTLEIFKKHFLPYEGIRKIIRKLVNNCKTCNRK